MKFEAKFNQIFLISILFATIVVVRSGIIFSYASDNLWFYVFLNKDRFIQESDVMSLVPFTSRSLWFTPMIYLNKFFGSLVLYYFFFISHIIIFYFIMIKIFSKYIETDSYVKLFLFLLFFANPNFFITGSTVTIPEYGFGYKFTSNLFVLLGLFYIIKNNNFILASFGYFISALIHLPSSITILPIMITKFLQRKFKIIRYFILFVFLNLIIIFFYKSDVNFMSSQDYNLIFELMNERQSYLFFNNWSLQDKINFVLIYLSLITFYFKISTKYKNVFLLLILLHVAYLILVILLNTKSPYAVFKYGFDLKFLVIFFIFELINQFDEKDNIFKPKNILIVSSVFSIFIFKNFMVFLIFLNLILLISKKKILFDKLFEYK